MRTLCLICVIWLVAAVSSAEPEQGSWNLRNHIPLDKVAVQSHRGAGHLMPENSKESFNLAWKLGTIPEADLRTSKDGVIVAFHDKNFKRILPDASPEMRQLGVDCYTWKELKAIDIGSWKGSSFEGQRIPRMLDVYEILKQHPNRKIYIDIKNVDLEKLAKESQEVHSHLILASTHYDVISKWAKLAPKSSTLHWMGGGESAIKQKFTKLQEQQFAHTSQLQIHVHVDEEGQFAPNEAFLKACGEQLRKHGVLFQALPWKNNDPEVLNRLMDLGVASFATDYPKTTMQAIRDYYKKQ